MPSSAAATMEAPPGDAELTGMGALPFVWYKGAVPDLELFENGAPLETDEVASAPNVSCFSASSPNQSRFFLSSPRSRKRKSQASSSPHPPGCDWFISLSTTCCLFSSPNSRLAAKFPSPQM